MNPTALQDAPESPAVSQSTADETPTTVIDEQAGEQADEQAGEQADDRIGATDEEQRAHRKPVLLPNRVGFVALIAAGVGLVLAILVLFVNIAWFLPLVAIVPAITLGILGLTLIHHRKLTSIAAIVVALIALIPSVTGYMMMTSSDTVLIGGGSGNTTSSTPTLDALMGALTGTDTSSTDDGAASGTDDDDNSNDDGTGGVLEDAGTTPGTTTPGTTAPGTTTPGSTTPGTTTPGTTTPGTTTPGTTTPGTTPSTPIVDVQIGTGTTPPATTTPPAAATPIVAVTTGNIGSLLTTSSGVKLTVNSSKCGLPLVNALGISLNLTGVLCAVNVSVTNGSDHVVDINSGGLTGLVGGASYLANATLGTSLSAKVAVGSSASGSLYVLLPLGSSSLDTVKIRLGGEPASSLLTVKVL